MVPSFFVSKDVPYSIFIVLFVFTELDDVMDRLQQGPSQPARPILGTTDTSGNKSVISARKKQVFSKETYKMKKFLTSDEHERLCVTGPTDPVAKPSQFS